LVRPPGSGETIAVEHLAHSLASQFLGEEHARSPWPSNRPPLPILIRVGRFFNADRAQSPETLLDSPGPELGPRRRGPLARTHRVVALTDRRRFRSRIVPFRSTWLARITDKLASYPPAIRRVLPNTEHRRHKRLNNRAENSHLPTRKRERILQ